MRRPAGFRRRVFQRLLPERPPPPSGASEAYYLQAERGFESIAEAESCAGRQLTEDRRVAIQGGRGPFRVRNAPVYSPLSLSFTNSSSRRPRPIRRK